jgi:hypothetical protein
MGKKIKGFVKSTQLVRVEEREVDYFSLQLLNVKKGDPKPTKFVDDIGYCHLRKIVAVKEYRTTYSLFGIVFWVYTKITEAKPYGELPRPY